MVSSGGSEDEFDWGSDEEGEVCAGLPSQECEAGPSRPNMISRYMTMGFHENLVIKAIKENGEDNENAILETLLNYSAIEKDASVHEFSHDLKDHFTNEDLSDIGSYSDECSEDDLSENKALLTLVKMGFTKDEASAAISRCGPHASLSELADSISAAKVAKEYDDYLDELGYRVQGHRYDPRRGKKKQGDNYYCGDKKKRWKEKETRLQNRASLQNGTFYESEAPISLPHPMIGFGLPNEDRHAIERKLSDTAIGPPYFYYENVAHAPKGTWETMSRFLYDIEPEFVDSKYFCAANRKRGYIHNLPIHNRYPLQPLPPRTVQEALPSTKKWWPSWDPRKQLNCLQTCVGSAALTERIRKMLAECDDPPPKTVQDYVLTECRKWNLVWVGINKVAPLEPHEIESILGFPRDHTRGGGISRTDRYKSLGNSFQVDTVAYHLSVLKDLFPRGMNVLSLFSGIGGAEVAIHRLGIQMNNVVSVEISEVNRNIIKAWWEQTGQTGNLIEIDDVQKLTGDRLEAMIGSFGGFDLVIGGSPCNNLTGSNRHHRDGLHGEHSSLFFDYYRIVDDVRSRMRKL